MTDYQLLEEITNSGDYIEVKQLADGTIVGLGNLLFTRAIYVDMDLYGWGKRFCFEDRQLATEQFRQLASGDSEPVGWVARR